jgi:outer membrane protein assembly factor BamB
VVADDGTVYLVTAGTGALYTLDASYALRSRFTASAGVTSTPAWLRTAAGISTLFIGSQDGTLVALDAVTFNRFWTYQAPAAISSSLLAIERPDGVWVYMGCADGYLRAVWNATAVWQVSVGSGGGVLSSSPAMATDARTVVIGSPSGVVAAYNATTGAPLWTYAAGGPVASTPALLPSMNAFVFGCNNGSIIAVDATGGAALWSFATQGAVPASAAVGGGSGADVVYIGSMDGSINALTGRSGERLWQFPAGAGVVASAIVDGAEVVFAATNNNTLVAIDGATGQQVWLLPGTNGNVQSSPVMAADGRLIVATSTGYILVFSGSV